MKEINGTKTPKVGDVWENDGLILHIDKFSEDKFGKIIYCYDMNKKGYVTGCWYYLDIFVNNAKYLGKSKARTKDLFGVKKSYKNVTQTDLHNIDDIQFPPRHDKTAYELQIENNKLKEKIEFAKQAVDLFFKTENESKLLEIAEWG